MLMHEKNMWDPYILVYQIDTMVAIKHYFAILSLLWAVSCSGLQIRGGKGYFSIIFLEISIEN